MVFGHPIFEKNSPRGEPHGGDRAFYIIIFSYIVVTLDLRDSLE